MTHFPAVKAQVYLLIVHTFHMLMLHLHPDVTKAHNNLSGQHISLSPFFFFSRVIKAPVICLGNQTRAALEQRAAGPTLEGPAGLAWRPASAGRWTAGGGEGNTAALSGLRFRGQKGKCGSAFQSCFRSDWNSQQRNNGTLSVFEQQQR